MIWPMHSPVIDGNRLHVYYAGNESLHGDLFNTKQSGPRKLKADYTKDMLIADLAL